MRESVVALSGVILSTFNSYIYRSIICVTEKKIWRRQTLTTELSRLLHFTNCVEKILTSSLNCYYSFPFNVIKIKLLPSAQSMKLKPNILVWAHVFIFLSPLILLECFYLPFTQLIILRTKNYAQIRKQISRQTSIEWYLRYVFLHDVIFIIF